jgi:hypothetical protein
VDESAVPVVAQALNISHAEVHGVITFYHDQTPAARPPHSAGLPRRILPGYGLRQTD